MGCTNRSPSFGYFYWVLGLFWANESCFEEKLRSFGRAAPDLASPPRGATGELLAQNLDLAGAPLELKDGRGRGEPGAMTRSNGQNAKEKCSLLACLLVVVAC